MSRRGRVAAARAPAALEGNLMLFFGRKKRLTDFASCAG
jgi:hypothetical protein